MANAHLSIFARPRTKIPGISFRDQGVVVAVREPARGGAANEACRRALAKALGVAPSRVWLFNGARSKLKSFRIEGMDLETVMARLADAAS